MVDKPDTSGIWIIEEPTVTISDEDIVYYWYYMAYDGEGLEITDL